jgi:hypothetical protein
MIHAVVLPLKKIPFVLLVSLPSSSPDFAFQKIAWQFWPVATGFSTWHWVEETMQRNVVWLSKTIVTPHLSHDARDYQDLDAYVAAWRDALVKALREHRAMVEDYAIHATSSFSPLAST